MKATKLKSLATTTGPTRLSAGPQAPYSSVAHVNVRRYGYGVGDIWLTTARLRVSSLSVMAVTIWLFVMIVWGISGSQSLVSGTVFEFVVFEEGSGKKSVTLGYASDIFNAFLSNVRWNIVYRVWYTKKRNILSCLRRKKRRGRPEEQIFHAGSEVPVSHCEGGRGWWLREEEVENKWQSRLYGKIKFSLGLCVPLPQ